MGTLVALSNGVSQLDVGEREGKNTSSAPTPSFEATSYPGVQASLRS